MVFLSLLLALAVAYGWLREEHTQLQMRRENLRQDNLRKAAAVKAAQVQAAAAPAEDAQTAYVVEAVRKALALPAGKERDEALSAIYLGSLRPTDALTVLQYFTSSGPRMHTLGMIYTSWAGREPQAAVAASNPIADPLERYYAQKAIAQAWGAKDPAAALAWVQTLPEGVLKAQSLQQIVARWAEQDLPGALAWMQQAPPGAARDAALRSVADKWAEMDPKGAVEGMLKMTPSALVTDSIARAVTTYAKSDPAAAAAYVGQIPDARSGETAALAVGKAWGAKDVTAAQAWAQTLPAGGTHDAAMAGVAGGWGMKDIKAALDWLQSWPAGPARDEAIYTTSMMLSSPWPEPKQLAELAVTMKPGEDQEMVYQVLGTVWGKKDLDGVTEWVHGLPVDSSRDNAMWRLSMAVEDNTTAATEQIAKVVAEVPSIKSTSMRQDVTIRIAHRWLKVDREAAAAWLNQTKISDADKAALLKTADAAK